VTVELVRIAELLLAARARGASDLHVGGSEPPSVRVDGRLILLEVPPLAAEAVSAFCGASFGEAAMERLRALGTADTSRRNGPGAPYRLHAYLASTGTRLAFRLHTPHPPSLEQLALPPVIGTFVERPNGLILFTGPTGSGKTTALAALVDRINRNAERVVVSVEDPVEYVHAPIRSLVAHCEVGRDVADYAEALRGFLRADPDVIMVGEMRDRETIEAALTAAETGHLVLSSLHTNDAAQTIDRIVDAFPSTAHPQVRGQLAATLIGIASLRLVPVREGRGRAAAAEILIATDAVRAMIREGKTHQLRNAIATGRAAGMQPLEAHLSDLVIRGRVSLVAARAVANHPDDVRVLERAKT
jgi:twitching motility protein PilT